MMVLNRVQHVVLGVLAGLAGWLLAEVLGERDQARLMLGLSVLAASFFGAALAALGQIGPRRALIGAGLVAAPVTLLMLWASFRFDDVGAFLQSGHVMMAALILAALPVPFLIGIAQGGRSGWQDYPALFVNSWNIVVRYAAAWAFVGLVWLVLLLSSELLQLVGVDLLRDLLREGLVIWLLSGATLGLGLAVVSELSDLVSPYLVLRLMRLLLPLVLVVVVVFVLVLPLRGLSELFGNLSAAAMLMATAAGVVSLISIAVDQSDLEAARGRVMNGSALGLALLLPVLSGLAAWAVALRVLQYGWTPGRVAAAAGVAVVLGYALFYLLAVASGRRWRARIRRGNLAMALVLIGLAALWLTPVLNAEAIAARSQLALHEKGETPVARLPLWELAHDWGRPGQAALTALRARAMTPDNAELAQRLALLDAADSRWRFENPERQPVTDAILEDLLASVNVLPAGRVAPDGIFSGLLFAEAEQIGADCARPAPGKRCVLILADLLPVPAGDEAVLVVLGGDLRNRNTARVFVNYGTEWSDSGTILPLEPAGTDNLTLDPGKMGAADLEIVPSGIMAIRFGGQMFSISP